jgi:hypothetical protein
LDSTSQPHHSNRRSGNQLFLGLILILIGVLFLLQQTGTFNFRNWWALFIFIPALGSFSTAWQAYQRNNHLTEGVRAGIGGGLIILTVALAFLFNLNWAIGWPLMIIVPGLVTFMNGFVLPGSRESEKPLSTHVFRPWSGWIGNGMICLGFGFLSKNLNWLDLSTIHPNWWAGAILIPALGGLITAIRLALSGDGWHWAAISNLALAAIFGFVGCIGLLGISWNLIAPILMITLGLIFLMNTLSHRKQ